MPTLHPLSPSRHADLRWQRLKGFAFAAQDTLAPLVIQELPVAMMWMPVGFVAAGPGFLPVAVQGLTAGQNLFVADNGRWVGGCIPAIYRSCPFQMANGENGQLVLCVDEELGCVSNGPAGEPFFAGDGQLAKPVLDVMNFLAQVAENRVVTARVCNLLQGHGLIQPWRITVQGNQGEQPLEGLYRIDKETYENLPAEALSELRADGALLLLHCQLLSMQHISRLEYMARARSRAVAKAVSPKAELNLEFLNQSGTISFVNLGR
jgi:hypothetical protein